MSVSRDNRFYFEGGKANHNQYAARRSHRAIRRRANMHMAAIQGDPENCDEFGFVPEVRDELQRYWCCESKTNMYNVFGRWIDHQVGRPWDKVYSEMCERFSDFRRSGWFRSHLRWKVCTRLSDIRSYWFDYFVDEGGILRPRDEYDGPRFNWSARPMVDINEFLADRLIARFCGELVWLVPTRWGWRYNTDRVTYKCVWMRCPVEYDLGDVLTPEEEDCFWIVRERIKVWDKRGGRRWGKHVLNGQPVLEQMLAA